MYFLATVLEARNFRIKGLPSSRELLATLFQGGRQKGKAVCTHTHTHTHTPVSYTNLTLTTNSVV